MLRRGRERAVSVAHQASLPPPDWEDTEEPSVTRFVEGPDGRVSVEGLGPDVAEVVKAYKQKHPSIYARAKTSIAPTIKKMDSRGGRIGAIVTLIVSALVAAVWNELAKRGVPVP
jgi:hypothetical protein